MDEDFEIPVVYKGAEVLIPARLIVQGYSYKIETDIDGAKVLFERDEEGAFRAIAPADEIALKSSQIALLEAIAQSLTELFN